MVSLSSMEAELFALQGVAQELASLGKLVGRVLKSLGRISVDELPSLLMTDSESSLKLLKNLDTPRKSRHLEIKLEWIKMQVNSGKLVVVFKRGTDNPADLLTKCLATSLYVIHRCSLGFETCDGPIASITKSFGNYILIEVCVSRIHLGLKKPKRKVCLILESMTTWNKHLCSNRLRILFESLVTLRCLFMYPRPVRADHH